MKINLISYAKLVWLMIAGLGNNKGEEEEKGGTWAAPGRLTLVIPIITRKERLGKGSFRPRQRWPLEEMAPACAGGEAQLSCSWMELSDLSLLFCKIGSKQMFLDIL